MVGTRNGTNESDPILSSHDNVDVETDRGGNSEHTTTDKTSCVGMCCRYIDSDEYFCFLPAEYIFVPKDEHRVVINNDRFASVLLVLNAMIGSGVLSQGWVVSESGIVLAAFVYPVIAAITVFGILVMIECANRVGVYHFGNLAHRVLGGFGLMLTEWSIIISILLCLIAYLLLIGDMLAGIVSHYASSSSTQWYLSRNFIVLVIVVLIVLPICLVRRLGHLTYVAYISQAIVLAVLIALFAEAPTAIAQHSSEALQLASFSGFLRSVGIVVFAVTFAPALFHVHRAMRLPKGPAVVEENEAIVGNSSSNSSSNSDVESSAAASRGNLELLEVTTIATAIGTVVLMAVGLVGYASYREDTQVNIVDNFPAALGVCYRVLVTVHLLLFIPAEFVIMRASFSNCLAIDVEAQDDVSYVLYTALSLLLVTASTLLLNSFAPPTALATLLNLCGGIACSLFAFVVPGMLGKAVFKPSSDYKPTAHSIYPLRLLSSCCGSSSNSCISSSSNSNSKGDDAFLFWGSVCLEIFGWLALVAVIAGQFVTY